MKTYQLEQDRKLFYVAADSFPEGIKPAFDRLQQITGKMGYANLFGISHGSSNGVVYKAAAPETYEGEALQLGCPVFMMKQGTYITETITDWKNKMETFSEVFDKMLADPRLDPDGACVEWYHSDEEVTCMVRIIT